MLPRALHCAGTKVPPQQHVTWPPCSFAMKSPRGMWGKGNLQGFLGLLTKHHPQSSPIPPQSAPHLAAEALEAQRGHVICLLLGGKG